MNPLLIAAVGPAVQAGQNLGLAAIQGAGHFSEMLMSALQGDSATSASEVAGDARVASAWPAETEKKMSALGTEFLQWLGRLGFSHQQPVSLSLNATGEVSANDSHPAAAEISTALQNNNSLANRLRSLLQEMQQSLRGTSSDQPPRDPQAFQSWWQQQQPVSLEIAPNSVSGHPG